MPAGIAAVACRPRTDWCHPRVSDGWTSPPCWCTQAQQSLKALRASSCYHIRGYHTWVSYVGRCVCVRVEEQRMLEATQGFKVSPNPNTRPHTHPHTWWPSSFVRSSGSVVRRRLRRCGVDAML